jgi:hypothetical protein
VEKGPTLRTLAREGRASVKETSVLTSWSGHNSNPLHRKREYRDMSRGQKRLVLKGIPRFAGSNGIEKKHQQGHRTAHETG